MRPRPRSIGVSTLILCGMSAALVAGCSSGPSYTTGSLRPDEGMVRDRPRVYPDGSYQREPYVTTAPTASYGYPPRQYTDPGTPTPDSYRSGGYGARGMETGSIGAPPAASGQPVGYDPDARWRQTPRERWQAPPSRLQQRPITSAGLSARPNTVVVRDGETLYSLSRQYNVPVGDLMAANRLPSERIAIGQELTIPIRYR